MKISFSGVSASLLLLMKPLKIIVIILLINLFPLDLNGYAPDSKRFIIANYEIGLKYNPNSDEFTQPTLLFKLVSSFGDIIWFREYYQSQPNLIRVAHTRNSLTFDLVVEPFDNNRHFQYSFQLVGNESEFSAWSVIPNRTYYNLSPGHYTLLVRAWDSNERIIVGPSLSIRILPPWYRQWPAILIYFIFTIILFSMVFKFRRIRNQKNLKKLENQIKLRTNLLMEQAEELKKEKNKYVNANQIKTRLLRFAAHDLRNPITAIMGYSKMLVAEDDPEKKDEYAQIIDDISKKMFGIVQNMLASGARDEDSLELDFEPVSVEQLVDKLVKQYHFFLMEKNQSLAVEFEPNLPKILADKIRFSEIIENILSNAIKYSPKNSEIKIKAYSETNPITGLKMVRTTVIDAGPGFSESDYELVFNEYQTLSAKPTSSKESSTGLGLFIAKQLVAAHDGKIYILNNSNGIGASISVTIPIASTSALPLN